MQNDYSQFEKRKQDHIELALMESNQASDLNTLDELNLIHEALPDLDFSELEIRTCRFGRPTLKPFLVSSMTAGHREAININRNLLEACLESQWAMGVGSQRRELTDPQASQEWQILRKAFPDVSLFSNLGLAQIINTPVSEIQRLTDALNAEALIIHCNPLQEVIQPEGTPNFKGCWQALDQLTKTLAVPIVIKETGCGFSLATLKRLNELNIAAVDVSGLGGTHWGRIEGHRAAQDQVRHKTAITFANWGIDTAQTVKNAASIAPHFEIWGSGGVRHGLDAAKLFALGANMVGFAKPMLDAALQNPQQVYERMLTIEYELKVAMFCTGSRVLDDLKGKICR